MKHIFTRFPAVWLAVVMMAAPQLAHAQAEAFFDIFVDIVSSVTPLIATIAVAAIVVLGIRMVSSTDEGALTKMRTTMAAIVIGLFMTLLAPNIINIFYYDQAIGGGGFGLVANQWRVRIELLGIGKWFQALAVIIAVFTIIISAFRAIVSYGDEGSLTAVKRQVIYGVVGILVIIFAVPFDFVGGNTNTPAEETLFDFRSPNALIEFIFYYVNLFLGFLLSVMVAVLIYAGLLMIFNLGDDSRIEQAKGIFRRSITGLLLVLFSAVITRIVLFFFGEA